MRPHNYCIICAGVNKGFGFVELLVTLAIVTMLAVMLTKTLRRNLDKDGDSGAVLGFKRIFEESVAKGGVAVLEAGPENVVIDSDGKKIGFRFSGSKPYGFVDKLDDSGWTNLVDNAYGLRFTCYGSNGSLILDEEASRNPSMVKRIKVSLVFHRGKEDNNYFIDDGSSGADLDGDKGNGTARLKTTSFIVDLD